MDNVCWVLSKKKEDDASRFFFLLLFLFLYVIHSSIFVISIISNRTGGKKRKDRRFCRKRDYRKSWSLYFIFKLFLSTPKCRRPCRHHILSIHQQYSVVVYYYDYDYYYYYYYSNLSCVLEMYKKTRKLMTIRRTMCVCVGDEETTGW